MNQRRKVIITLGLGLTLAMVRGASHAASKVYRVAILMSNSQAGASKLVNAFKKALRELGYIDGQNVTFDIRSIEGDLKRLPSIAAEIVAQKPDVIFGSTILPVRALQQATKAIPIVMTWVSDPVLAGFAKSLAHPGGNVTGVSDMGGDLGAKRIEIIRIIAPAATRIGTFTVDNKPAVRAASPFYSAAKATGLSVHEERVTTLEELRKAFSMFERQKVSAVIMPGGAPFNYLRKEIAELAVRSRMFTISPTRDYVEAGGLVSYGANPVQLFELAAGYVDKILKGAKPGDLPIQQPTKFELVINGKTAKALGITLSQELLLRADEVIE